MYRLLLLLVCAVSFNADAQHKPGYSPLFKDQVGAIKMQHLTLDQWKADTARKSDLTFFLSKPKRCFQKIQIPASVLFCWLSLLPNPKRQIAFVQVIIIQ